MSWERTQRTLLQFQQGLSTAETPEQCQAIGALARDALISLAQAVFEPTVHWHATDPPPSATDSKRQLEAYVAVAFAGGGKEEARSLVRSAVQLADALTHKRTATSKDARLAAVAAEAVIRLIAIAEDHELPGSDANWHGVQAGTRYFAWDGPQLHALPDRQPIPAPQTAIDALKASGHTPSFGRRDRLRDYQAQGAFQVFETDRTSWRRELLHAPDGQQVLLIRPSSGGAA